MADEKKKIEENADLSVLFNENTSDEAKESVRTIFEAAVEAKAQQMIEEIDSTIDDIVEERLTEASALLEDAFDRYVSYVAEEWLSENEIAIESSMKVDMAESLMGGLANLFVEHNLEVPEEAEGILESLADRNEELTSKLNEQINQNIALAEREEMRQVEQSVTEAAAGLPDTQAAKLKELAENVRFKDAADFKKKLSSLKETLFKAPITEQNRNPVDGGEINEGASGSKVVQSGDPMVAHILKGFKSRQ